MQRRQIEKPAGFLLALADFLFGALLVVDVGGRANEFKDFVLRDAEGKRLLEMPAIGTILSAEGSGFESKTLP